MQSVCKVPDESANTKCSVGYGDCTLHCCISCKELCHPFCVEPVDEGCGAAVVCNNCLREGEVTAVKSFPVEKECVAQTLPPTLQSGRKRPCQSDDEREEGNSQVKTVFFYT